MPIDYGKALKKFRVDKDLSRGQLSKLTGLSISRIGDIENNRYKDPTKSIKSLLQEMDYSFVDFLTNYAGVNVVPSSKQDNTEEKHHSNIEESQINDLIEVLDFIQHETNPSEFRLIKDFVDFIQWKKEQNKSTPE